MQQLKLKKCAYIFHSSNNIIWRPEDRQINKILKGFYDNESTRETLIDCKENSDHDCYIINIDNVKIVVNPAMILYSVETDKKGNKKLTNHIHNDIVYFDFDNEQLEGCDRFYKRDFYNKKYRSLTLENLCTDTEDLGYFRLHFKYNMFNYVITKSGEIYEFRDYATFYKKPITIEKIAEYLDIKSDKAFKELKNMIDYTLTQAKRHGKIALSFDKE